MTYIASTVGIGCFEVAPDILLKSRIKAVMSAVLRVRMVMVYVKTTR